MRDRYRLFRNNARGGSYYIQDNITGKQESLRTKDRATAKRLWQARNEANRLPAINLQIAPAYVTAADPKMAARTWDEVMGAIASQKQGETQRRWLVATKDKALDLIRQKPLLETTSHDLLTVMATGTVSTNVYLRRIHNFALDMDWLLKSIIPRRQWPKIVHAKKRAITFEEHQRIIEAEAAAALRNQGSRNSDEPHYNERLALYKLCWHFSPLGHLTRDLAALMQFVLSVDCHKFSRRQRGLNSCLARFGGDDCHGADGHRMVWLNDHYERALWTVQNHRNRYESNPCFHFQQHADI